MSITRRNFIKTGAMAASVAALPRPLLASFGGRPVEIPAIADAGVKELALAAVDAATKAGAAYADVRLSHSWLRRVSTWDIAAGDSEWIEVGVRALVRGYWGFASGPVWTLDEMARLGREAVHQATTNALGKTREVSLAPTPVVRDGHWSMPIELDPFAISPFEMHDYIASLQLYARHSPGGAIPAISVDLLRQEKAFASSEGTYCTQRVYRTGGGVLAEMERNGRKVQRRPSWFTPAGLGWEHVRRRPMREIVRRELEEMERDTKLPIKPVEVGRYPLVTNAEGVASLLDETLGRATELDRALGFEANAGGTSFVNRPLEMIGSYTAGSSQLTVTANRTEPGGAATVKWDDEGVEPDAFTLVDGGVLADFQTTRESAGWLAPYYARHGRPFRSHGCANTDSAVSAPMQHTPNLAMRAGREAIDYEGLLAGIADGIAVEALQLDMDFQNLNGLGTGRFYEVKKGKRTAILATAGLLFRAPELWKSIITLGGPASAARYGAAAQKGEPPQATFHSVTAVPAVFKDVTLIDPQRKA